MIELVDVTKDYGEPGKDTAVHVLKGISLTIERGQGLAIVGPSGCGKSTLLNLIGGIDRPTSGRVLFEGVELAALSDSQLAEVRSRDMGFVFQLHHLLPQCTALENVLVPTLTRHDESSRDARERAEKWLERVGLKDRMNYRPGELSGGQRQRVAVARALINKPKLLLADEPTGSLDETTSEEMGQLLADLNREEGVTLVVVTHSRSLASRLSVLRELHNGRLSGRGSQ